MIPEINKVTVQQ